MRRILPQRMHGDECRHKAVTNPAHVLSTKVEQYMRATHRSAPEAAPIPPFSRLALTGGAAFLRGAGDALNH
jgi:hypothetical protein